MLYSELPDDNDDNSNIIWCFGDTTMNMCGHVHTGAAHEANFDVSSISSITKREWNKVMFDWKHDTKALVEFMPLYAPGPLYTLPRSEF